MTHPDALVLGAGIIGLAVARALAADGLRVEVLDSQDGRAAASFAAGGILGPLFETGAPPPLIAASREGRDLWQEWAPALAAETGMDVGYDRSGSLQLALDDEDDAALDATLDAARRLGETAAPVELADLPRRTPGLAPQVRRAVHLAGEHRVDNVAVCQALAAALARRGVAVRHAVRTLDVRRVAGAAPAVRLETSAGSVQAGLLVVAAGAWSGSVPGLPPLPVRPVRGQMARLGGVAWPWSGAVRRHRVYFVRRGAHDVLVGATVEEAGFTPHPTVAGVAGLLARATQTYPALADARLEAVWAGLRPGTPDDLPIVGWLPGWPAIAATGHFRSGILLAPWTARLVARLAIGESGTAADGEATATRNAEGRTVGAGAGAAGSEATAAAVSVGRNVGAGADAAASAAAAAGTTDAVDPAAAFSPARFAGGELI